MVCEELKAYEYQIGNRERCLKKEDFKKGIAVATMQIKGPYQEK
jgi:hypothetical protein